MAYNVLLYENNRLMMGRLSTVINNTPGFRLVAHYRSRQDALGQGKMFNPNIVLVDIEGDTSPNLIESFCNTFPDAAIICMGESWHAESAGHLVQSGAKGYINKPFSSEELQTAVSTFGHAGMSENSYVMTFFSPKGKSGKTTLIANLALTLARKTGEKVCIIDADLQFGDMSVFFNLTPRSTIVEATRDRESLSPISLQPYFTPVTENVSVMCGTKNPSLIDRVSIEALEALVTMSKSIYRYVLVDVPAGFTPTSIAMAELSDATYIVCMNNGGFEIKHMKRAIDIFRDWEDIEERLFPVITRVNPCNEESRLNLQDQLEFNVEGILPNEYMLVSEAANNGRMALDILPDSKLTVSITRLADKIIRRQRAYS